jgi:hypothetical protein
MWKSEVHKFLQDSQIVFEVNHSLSIFEVLYLPDFQLFLHLIDIREFSSNIIPITYFQDLSDKVNAQNQRIIHLWEDVWITKQLLVESRILAMTGLCKRVNGRHCFVSKIDKQEADNFLNINHLQGAVKAKYKYGLFLKVQYAYKYLDIKSETDILVAVATFSGGRTMNEPARYGNRSFELLRFASLKNHVIVGGMDKLLKYFEKEYQPDEIMSYADRDWSNGNSYMKLGFTKMNVTPPQRLGLNTISNSRLKTSEEDENILEVCNSGNIKIVKFIKKSPSSKLEEEDFWKKFKMNG